MSSYSGVNPINNYAGAASDPARVQLLLDLIPNVDAPLGTGSGSIASAKDQGVSNTYLDEMSPGAAAQLWVELLALKASVT